MPLSSGKKKKEEEDNGQRSAPAQSSIRRSRGLFLG
jgi:hypothetical protein